MIARLGASRVILALAVVGATTLLPVSCNSSPVDEQLVGYVPGPVFDVPAACCSDDDYLTVQAIDCPRSGCSDVAYAVCRGGTYAGCTCTLPPDSGSDSPCSIVDPFEDAAGGGSAGSAGAGGSKGCIERGDADSCNGPGDGPLFDVGNVGDCTGQVAKEIPARECGSCEESPAYALCDGVFFGSCSCELPPGYVVIDAGAAHDSGSKDGTVD